MPQIERVTYEKIFPLAPYINEKIGVSYLLMKGDDPKVVLQAAKDLCEEFHRESKTESLSHQLELVPEIHTDKPSLSNSLIRDIKTCTELKVLESYKILVKGKPELQTAYDQQFKNLKNKTNGNNL